MSKRCYYKPNREYPRRFNARAVGRIARYAKEAGESDNEICFQLSEQAQLRCGECDCVKLKALVALALGVMAFAAAVRIRNKEAMTEAIAAISKAQRSARGTLGRIELEKVNSLLILVDSGEDSMQEELDKLNDELLNAMKQSFEKPTGEEGEVNIRE